MRITEKKKIIINTQCVENPVYLAWMNKLSGWNYWLFSYNQLVNLATGNEQTYQSLIKDLESAESTEEVQSLESAERMTVGADGLNINDAGLVNTILDSVKVQMLMNPATWQAEGAKWQTVILDRGTFLLYETSGMSNDVSFSFRFSKKIMQRQ